MRFRNTRFMNMLMPVWLLILATGCATIRDAGEFRKNHIDEFRRQLDEGRKRLTNPMTLEACIALALENNYDARQADIRRELARLNRNTSFSSFLPTITGSASITNWEFAQSMSGMQTSDATVRSYELKLQVPLLVPSAYFIFQNSRQGLDVAELSAHYTRQLVVLTTSTAYYQVLITQKQIKTLESQVEASDKLLDRVKGLAENGLATSWQAGEAGYISTARRASLETARRKLVADKGELLRLMGLDPMAEITLADDFAPLTVPGETPEQMMETALQAHPSLYIADQQTVIAENNVRASIADFFPMVGVIGSSSWTSNSFVDHANTLYISLMGTMDLFKGFSKVFNYKSAKFRRESARLDREAVTLSILLEVVKAYNMLREADSTFKVTSSEYEFTKAKFADYEARYKEGLIPIHELLDMQSDLFLAETRLARAYYASHLAKSQLDLAMGTLVVPGREDGGARIDPESKKN